MKKTIQKATTWWRSLEQWHFKTLPRWKLCSCDSECVFVAPQIPAASSPHLVWSPRCIHYLSLQRPFETQISCHAECLVVAHAFEYVNDFLGDAVAGWRKTEGGKQSELHEKGPWSLFLKKNKCNHYSLEKSHYKVAGWEGPTAFQTEKMAAQWLDQKAFFSLASIQKTTFKTADRMTVT